MEGWYCGGCQGPRYFKGLIDEVDIFNRALSASDIVAIYNAGNAGKCTTPPRHSLILNLRIKR